MGSVQAPRYDEAAARRWLGWLAREMQRRGTTVFQIEDLQPECLGNWSLRLTYLLLTRLPIVFAVVSSVVWMGGRGGYYWPVVGLIWWLASTLAGVVDLRRPPSSIGRRVVRSLVLGAAVGLPSFFLFPWDDEALMFTLIALGLGLGRPRSSGGEIQTIENLKWSWRWGAPGTLMGLALVIWAMAATAQKYPLADRWDTAYESLAAMALAVLVAGVLMGLRGGIDELKVHPNQGIRLTLKYSALVGLGVLLCFALLLLIPGEQMPPEGLSIQGRLTIEDRRKLAQFAGVCSALLFGVRAVVRHSVLRVMLWVTGAAPLRIARFLDYAATDLQLLQKVGGGYIFIHRMMLEHFAGLDDPSARARSSEGFFVGRGD